MIQLIPFINLFFFLVGLFSLKTFYTDHLLNLVIFYVNENDQDLTPTMQEITRLSDLYIKLDNSLTNYHEQADLLVDTKNILLEHIDNMDDLSKVDKTLERVENINKEIEHVNDQITSTREHLREVTREIEDAETRPE